MKALKAGLIISLTVFFSIACDSNTANNNSNQNANRAAADVPPVLPTDQAINANTNDARPPGAYPGSGSGEPAAGSNPATMKEADKPAGDVKPASIDAASLYTAQKCDACHGPDGKGKVKGTPDFTDAAWQKKESDAELTRQIKNGEPPKMPAYKDKLSEAEIKALVGYVRSFAK